MASEPVNVQNFEGGASIGITHPFASYPGWDTAFGLDISAEVRYNIPSTKWDAGVFYSYTEFNRSDDRPVTDDWGGSNFGVCGHYNFRQGYKVNPFAGIGVGAAYMSTMEQNKWSATFIPTVGIEINQWLRISLDVHLSRKCSNGAALTVGFVIGGRPRR